MKKKLIIVLLSVTLVLAFASTGVFADTITAYPPYGGNFTQVVSGERFFNINYTDLAGTTESNPLLLFNGLYAFETSSTDYAFIYNGSVSSSFSKGRTNLFASGSNLETATLNLSTNSNSFGTSGGSSVQIAFNGVSLKISDLGISFGSTVEWSDVSAVVDRFKFSLPYGNALMISSESDFVINRRFYSISNTTYNYQKYVRASDNFSYRVNGSYQGVVENSNVVGTFGVNVFGSNDVVSLLIPWQPVNQNVLGRATSYNYYNASPDSTAEVSVLSGQSFMIWYPYYANNQDTSKINETNMEVSIDIYHSAPITFTTFPITGSTASSGEDTYIQNTVSVSSGGSSSQSVGGDGSINVSFDNAPSAGGNHGQAPINDNNSILGVLSNLQNTLLGLFNKAIDGIHNLITLGSDFLQSVQIMFSWLPAELLVIIISGFVILLTIGVLKTLWR